MRRERLRGLESEVSRDAAVDSSLPHSSALLDHDTVSDITGEYLADRSGFGGSGGG